MIAYADRRPNKVFTLIR
ncbi:hypothetical protein [Escherichia coli]|nr:hypothetical protein [Escherichia coli]